MGLDPRLPKLFGLVVISLSSKRRSVGEWMELILILDIEPLMRLIFERREAPPTTPVPWLWELLKLAWLLRWLDVVEWFAAWLVLRVHVEAESPRLSSSGGRHVSTIASRQSTNNSTFSGFSLAVKTKDY